MALSRRRARRGRSARERPRAHFDDAGLCEGRKCRIVVAVTARRSRHYRSRLSLPPGCPPVRLAQPKPERNDHALLEVHGAGLEPARLSTEEPKPSASAIPPPVPRALSIVEVAEPVRGRGGAVENVG